MRFDDYKRRRWWHVNTFRFDPARLIGGILFIIAWATGEVSGILAWAILCLFLSFEFKWKR